MLGAYPQVGMMSINDTFILQSLIPRLVSEVIVSKALCFDVLKVFEDIKLRTEVGQMLDLNTVSQESRSLRFEYSPLPLLTH